MLQGPIVCKVGAFVAFCDLFWTPKFMLMMDTKHMLHGFQKSRGKHDLCAQRERPSYIGLFGLASFTIQWII